MTNIIKFPEPERRYIGDDGTYVDLGAIRRRQARMTPAERRAEIDAINEAEYGYWCKPPLPTDPVYAAFPECLDWAEDYIDWCKWVEGFRKYHGFEVWPE